MIVHRNDMRKTIYHILRLHQKEGVGHEWKNTMGNC
jgi:hypothetical protein